jgi:predicted glycosyltransferase
VRIVSFDAHHDDDVEGIDSNLLSEIVSKLEAHGKVFISSEKKLPDEFNKYRLVIDPRDIHHYLNYASLVIGDSQSMIHEAALLGTPAIRYNSFIGKIGVFNLLENKYKLSIGIMAGDKEGLLAAIDRVMLDDGYKDQMKQNLKEMRADCEDVNQFVLDHLKGLVGNPDLDERDSKSI